MVAVVGCHPTDKRNFKGLTVSPDSGERIATSVRHLSHCPTDNKDQIVEISPPTPSPAPRVALTGAIAGVVASFAADFAISYAGKQLEEADKGRSGSFLALGVDQGAEVVKVRSGNPQGTNCLVIYRGAAQTPLSDDAAAPRPEFPSGKLTPAILSALGLSDYPAFYLELATSTPAASPPHRVLTAKYLHYAASSARVYGSGRKTVTMVLARRGASPGADADGATIAADALEVYRFNLGRLEIGRQYGFSGDVRSAHAIASPAIANYAALVSEADDPSTALTALTEAFEGNKDDINSTLVDLIKESLSREEAAPEQKDQ